jgi:hypothetical protein
MQDEAEKKWNTGRPGKGDESSLGAATAVTLVVLLALCSAVYFVETRQQELKAANAMGATEAAPDAGTTDTAGSSK